jgi:hypothetical protein
MLQGFFTSIGVGDCSTAAKARIDTFSACFPHAKRKARRVLPIEASGWGGVLAALVLQLVTLI